MVTTRDICNEILEAQNNREGIHGETRACHQYIADYWNSYLKHNFKCDINLKDYQVAEMLQLFKIARNDMPTASHDTRVDRDSYGMIATVLREK